MTITSATRQATSAGQGTTTPSTGPLSGAGPWAGPAPELPSLTGLRWVAAFVVFAYHVKNFEWFGGTPGEVVAAVFGGGQVGVSFFFVLSGFVLAWSARPGEPMRSFWRRRLARIYPAHLVTAVLALGLILLGVPSLRVDSLPAVTANLLLVSAWNHDWWQTLNPASWTLVVEAFFYLTFPVVFAALRGRRVRTLLAVAALAVAATMLMPRVLALTGYPVQLKTFPATRWSEFLLGVALGIVVRRVGWRGPGLPVAWAVLAAGYLVSLQVRTLWSIACCTVIGFALVIAAAARTDLTGHRVRLLGRRVSVLGNPVMVRLGEWSYAFYLVHLLVMRVFQRFVGWHPNLPLLPAAALTVAAFAVSLAAAALLYTLVEVPGRQVVLGRFRPRRPDPRRLAAGAGLTALVVVAAAAVVAAAVPHRVLVVGAAAPKGVPSSTAWARRAEPLLRQSDPTVQVRAITSAPAATSLPDPAAQAAVDRLLDRPGLRTVVLTDLLTGSPTGRLTGSLTGSLTGAAGPTATPGAGQVLDGVRRFVAAARDRDVRVVATTVPPFGGSTAYTPDAERDRQAVNAALRAGGLVDAVIDADAALADPVDPTRLRADVDSGDHLHPGPAGHRLVAELAARTLG